WLQAILLRVLGPAGDLSLRSIDAVRVPAAISLLWAVSGAVLTFWGHQRKSRPLWVGGATLLVGATVKIVLFDIGSLGELSNILAVIAAGLVFLAVGWVAPMPPAPPPRAQSAHQQSARTHKAPPRVIANREAKTGRVWTIVLVAVLLLPVLSYGEAFVAWLATSTMRSMQPRRYSAPPPRPIPAPV